MILADKIIHLRKKHDMTQEDLAEMIEVSRQSISKWEGALSIPDINKIMKMSEVFGVSTDFLLNDNLDLNNLAPHESEPDQLLIKIGVVREYLDYKQKNAHAIALSVVFFIVAAVMVILSTNPLIIRRFGENVSLATSLSIGLVFVVIGIANIIMSNQKPIEFEHIEQDDYTLEYGATGIIEKIKEHYRTQYNKKTIIGIGLIVMSLLPLFISLAYQNHEQYDLIQNLTVVLFMLTIAVGVYFIIQNNIYWTALNNVLITEEKRSYDRQVNQKAEKIGGIYWPIVIAIYIGYSLLTQNWHISWIIWPVASLLFGAIQNMFR